MEEKEINETLNEEVLESSNKMSEKHTKNKKNKHEEIDNLKQQIDALKKEMENSNNEVLRHKADLINYRKRKDEETSNLLKYANGDLLSSLLLIVDNFEIALKNEDETFKSYLDGFRLIYNQIIDLLNSYEVKEIDALGKEFNPLYHQSVAVKKDETKEPSVVLEVYKKGYTYKDKVLRPAMVIINE